MKLKRPEDRLSIRLLQAADVCFSRIYHQTHLCNPLQLPKRSSAILVSNHTSGLDPLLIQAVCPRLIIWMMAREYYDMKGLGWFFRTVEAIPVDRGGRDLAATRAALRALHHGHVLGIFPEGRIEDSHDLLPFQTGAAMMAIRTGVPVYPCYLDGTQRNKSMLDAYLLPNRATIRFGPPVQIGQSSKSKDDLEEVTAKIKAAIAALVADR